VKRKPKKLSPEALGKVADVFKAFSEPTRLPLIQELKAGPQSVLELVDALETSQANVSKQLRLLYEAQILKKSKEGTMVFYCIDDDIVFPLCKLACEKLNQQHRRRHEDYSIKAQSELGFFVPSSKSTTSCTLSLP
jgi:DNA-binding transcriptional ArsR family regulator